jgi:Family of unknown function (DUF6527)
VTKVSALRPEFVEFIPAKGEPGVIYVSERFRTAMHLCCCGCGLEVATPLNPAKWTLRMQGGQVSLSPSIGNWSFPCRSHYWVRWAESMSDERINVVRHLDATAATREFDQDKALRPLNPKPPTGLLSALKRWLLQLFH